MWRGMFGVAALSDLYMLIGGSWNSTLPHGQIYENQKKDFHSIQMDIIHKVRLIFCSLACLYIEVVKCSNRYFHPYYDVHLNVTDYGTRRTLGGALVLCNDQWLDVEMWAWHTTVEAGEFKLTGAGFKTFWSNMFKKNIKNKHMHGLIVHNKVFKMYLENSGWTLILCWL